MKVLGLAHGGLIGFGVRIDLVGWVVIELNDARAVTRPGLANMRCAKFWNATCLATVNKCYSLAPAFFYLFYSHNSLSLHFCRLIHELFVIAFIL